MEHNVNPHVMGLGGLNRLKVIPTCRKRRLKRKFITRGVSSCYIFYLSSVNFTPYFSYGRYFENLLSICSYLSPFNTFFLVMQTFSTINTVSRNKFDIALLSFSSSPCYFNNKMKQTTKEHYVHVCQRSGKNGEIESKKLERPSRFSEIIYLQNNRTIATLFLTFLSL